MPTDSDHSPIHEMDPVRAIPLDLVGDMLDHYNAPILKEGWNRILSPLLHGPNRPLCPEVEQARQFIAMCRRNQNFHYSALEFLVDSDRYMRAVRLLGKAGITADSIQVRISTKNAFWLMKKEGKSLKKAGLPIRQLNVMTNVPEKYSRFHKILGILPKLQSFKITLENGPEKFDSCNSNWRFTNNVFENCQNLVFGGFLDSQAQHDIMSSCELSLGAFSRQFFSKNSFPDLRHLKVCNTLLQEGELDAVVTVANKLETLEISGCPLLELDKIVHAFHCSITKIHSLTLRDVGFKYVTLDKIQDLGFISQLKELDIRDCALYDKVTLRLLKGTNKGLRKLSFQATSSADFPPSFYQAMLELCPKLEQLTIQNCQEGFPDVCLSIAQTRRSLTEKATLRCLDITTCVVEWEALRWLAFDDLQISTVLMDKTADIYELGYWNSQSSVTFMKDTAA